jgi:DeoR/GlpR family transcriptional regulator of sugar metabolism
VKQPYPKHRLRQKELVMNIFFLFEREYERSDLESIWELRLPVERVKKELEEICSIHYRSNLWIYTQLRRYEEDLGAQLFRKDSTGCPRGSFHLSICDRMLTFAQKQHLYVSDKIKVANGAYDKITNEAADGRGQVRIFLGAGSTIYHLANILAERSWPDTPGGLRYRICTHNLGALRRLLEPAVNYDRLEITLPQGTVDPVTYAILGDPAELAGQAFDYLIMGTSYILDGRLYVESAAESVLKAALLRRLEGQKILLLTKHEFTDQPLPGLRSYGSLTDYDFVIVPKHPGQGAASKKYESIFEGYESLFEPEIIHWNYTIFKVRKEQA